MERRRIGASGPEVSSISLGSWVFGGDCWGAADDAVSIKVINEAIDAGINFIDTAPVYGSGRSEEVIGRAIKGRREGLVIATKCGLEQKGKSIRPNLSASFIREEVERSLTRLGVDTVDIYQCHWPDPGTPLEETFSELNSLVREGKVRHLGVSNFSRGLLEEASGYAPVISDQLRYSLLDRDIETEMTEYCSSNGMSILSYGSLGGGILTGKYKEPPVLEKGDVRTFFYKYYRDPLWSKARKLVDLLENIAADNGVGVSRVAVSWVLRRGEVASCILGCRTPRQLEQNVTPSGWRLSDGELEEIEKEYDTIMR